MRAARHRGLLVKLSLFTTLAILASGVVYSTLVNNVSGETRSFHAVFSDVSGVRTGDDVRMAGVKVGRIDAVERDGNVAILTFRVQADQRVYENTRLEIRYQNLIGMRYLALVQGRADAPRQEDGSTIPIERTKPPLNLSELFNGFAPLFDVLGPDEINLLSENLVKAVQGSGPALHALLADTAELTSELATRDAIIGEVVTNLAGTLEHLAAKGEEYDALVAQTRKLVRGFAANSELVFSTLDAAESVARRTNALLADLAPVLEVLFVRFNDVAEMFLNARPQVEDTLEHLPVFLGSLAKIHQYGSWMNLYGCSMEVLVPGVDGNVLPPPSPNTKSEVCR